MFNSKKTPQAPAKATGKFAAFKKSGKKVQPISAKQAKLLAAHLSKKKSVAPKAPAMDAEDKIDGGIDEDQED